jgi:hypothetical protein
VSDATVLVYENATIDPPVSYGLVLAVDVAFAVALAVCLRRIGAARRAVQGAEACVDPKAPLAEEQRFVAGKAALAADETVAVRVTVTQRGVERSVKNGHVHDWRETARVVAARPFYVCHESGERVRVEVPAAAGRVRLVDALDQEEWVDRAERRLRAELTPGERVVVEGRLVRGHDPEGGTSTGYRDAAQGWVMQPGRGGRMHLSAEDLAHHHRLRLRALERLFPFLLGAWVLAQAPLVGFRLRQFSGVDVVDAYSGKHTYLTRDSKGRTTTHRVVDFTDVDRHGQPTASTAEVSAGDFEALPTSPGTIHVRRVAHAPFATALGRGAAVSSFAWGASLVIAFVALMKLRGVLVHRRWYERKVNELGLTGKLPSPPGTRFPAPRSRKR